MKRKHNQGFSLVELLIAIAILSLIMIALASFMGTTTNSYVRSRNDIELQQTGQEVFDMISDKLMQAKLVRIGTQEREYAAVGTAGSAKAGADFALLDDAGAPLTTTDGRPRYSFDALTQTAVTDTNYFQYIAVVYETAMLDASGDDAYGAVADVFYFHEGDIYLFRTTLSVRPSSNNDGASMDSDPTLESLDASLSSCITTARSNLTSALASESALVSLRNEKWVCNTVMHNGAVPAAGAYALTDENALYLYMDFEKQGMENRAEGMITIRNSYVLKPKASPSAGSGSSDSGTPIP